MQLTVPGLLDARSAAPVDPTCSDQTGGADDGSHPPIIPRELEAALEGYRSEAVYRRQAGPVPRLCLDTLRAGDPPAALADVTLEIDWSDGIEDLIRVEDLLVGRAQETDNGRHVQLVQRGEDTWELRAWGPQARLRSIRAHCFPPGPRDLPSVLVQLELAAAPDTGLYRPEVVHPTGGGDPTLDLGPSAGDLSDCDGAPTLLLVHGTAGSIELSFQPLAAPGQWNALQAAYGTRILAYEHRTLAEGLLTSAVGLLRGLRADMTLDVLALSRGGMFLELLVHGPVAESTAREVAQRVARLDQDRNGRRDFRGFDVARFVHAFSEFNRLWQEKRPRIRRLVRVGCAISGIPRLRRGWQRYLGLLFASGRLARDPQTLAARTRLQRNLALLRSLRLVLTASYREHEGETTDSLGLPGLDAQRPDAPVLHLLNRAQPAGAAWDSELLSVAGDYRGDSPLTRRLQRWATELHGLADLDPPANAHDLVVPLQSTSGGLPRARAREHVVQGTAANHFKYLQHPPTLDLIAEWLLREPAATDEAGVG